MGDPARVALLKTVIDVIEEDKLLERVQGSDAALMSGLLDLQVTNIRRLYVSNGQIHVQSLAK